MTENIAVEIKMVSGAIESASVEIRRNEKSGTWAMRLDGVEIGEQNFEGQDLFEAMIRLRHALEHRDAQLLCVGARPDVFPSGMSRGMGAGRKAYVTRMGEPARRTDLLDIFDYAAPGLVGTVEQQADFHAKWAESLGTR